MTWVAKEEWRNKAAWEAFWQNLANSTEEENYLVEKLKIDRSYLPKSPLFGSGFARDAFINNSYQKHLDRRCRILFLGNGVSREPLDYYYSGFDVTVVDISPKACELFKEIANKVDNNVRLFLNKIPAIDNINEDSNSEDKLESNQFIYRTGGSIKVICADMFDWNPPEKYNYIHNKLAFLGFSESDREGLLNRYFNWLEDGGNLQISYYFFNNNPYKQIFETAKEIGFLINDEHGSEAFKESLPFRKDKTKYKEFCLEYQTQELDKQLSVIKGKKMLWVRW